MKIRALVLLAMAVLVGVFVAAASTARPPTGHERTLIVQAVTAGMEAAQSRSVPSFRGRVTSVKVSTIITPRAFFKRYAVVDYFDPTIGAAAVLVGLRGGYWHVLSYGSSDVGCGYPQRLLGWRRAAVLADLGLTCH